MFLVCMRSLTSKSDARIIAHTSAKDRAKHVPDINTKMHSFNKPKRQKEVDDDFITNLLCTPTRAFLY